MSKYQSEYCYVEARKALGLTMDEMADVLDLPIGIWSMMETGEKPVDTARHHYIVALIDGFRPPDWPIVEQRPELKTYSVKCNLAEAETTLIVRGTSEADAKVRLAIIGGIHIERMLEVKDISDGV